MWVGMCDGGSLDRIAAAMFEGFTVLFGGGLAFSTFISLEDRTLVLLPSMMRVLLTPLESKLLAFTICGSLCSPLHSLAVVTAPVTSVLWTSMFVTSVLSFGLRTSLVSLIRLIC